jgi:hypothetical protein
MDRTPLGSSTPSRKRSRWDNDEEQDIPTQPSPKHFLKPKHSKAPTINSPLPLSQPTQRPSLHPTPSANKLYTVCVPPSDYPRSLCVLLREVEPNLGVFVWRYLSCSRYADWGYCRSQEAEARRREVWVVNYRSEGDQCPHGLPTRARREVVVGEP